MTTAQQMQGIAKALDEGFNGDAKGSDRRVAFVVLTANVGEFDGTGMVNYVSNAERPDIIVMMKELIARWEGRRDPAPERLQ